MAKVGKKLALDKKKLKALFQVMINSAPTPKYVAYGLGIKKPETIKEWIKAGEILQEQFEDKLEELDEIFPFAFEEVFENRKLEFEARFCELYALEPEAQIPDRLKLTYELFINKEKQIFIENCIENREKEILENIIFVEDKTLNEDYKLLIQFARIFQRAKCVIEMGLLNSINKHSHTAKNVALGYKLLQTYNKEEFGETQTVKHEGTIEVNQKSILGMALLYEKSQREQEKMIEQKNENIIDVTKIKQIEQKLI